MIVPFIFITTLFESFTKEKFIKGRPILIVFQYLFSFNEAHENSAKICRTGIFDEQKTETTVCLYLKGAKEWKFITRPVSVAFWYHVDDNLLLCCITFMSRKGISQFFSISTVNFRERWNKFISCNFWSILSLRMVRIVSSMYVTCTTIHLLGVALEDSPLLMHPFDGNCNHQLTSIRLSPMNFWM